MLIKAGFEEFPKDISELEVLCTKLNSLDISPIIIGLSEFWPAAAWFDYLNLRIHGLEFYKQLTKGDISYLDPRVIETFESWKGILEAGCIVPKKDLNWKEVLPFMLRDKAAMLLSGNFVESELARNKMSEDIEFAKFPTINEKINRYELAPTDIFILNKKRKLNKDARKVLLYITSMESQSYINTNFGISTNINAKNPETKFSIIGKEHLHSASGLTQYFDRDTPINMSYIAVRIFSDFIEDGDIEKATTRLEKARLSAEESPDNLDKNHQVKVDAHLVM